MTQSTTHSASEVPLPSPKERRRLREAMSMSEEQVARAVGVTRATVRAWETGRSDPRGRRRETYGKLLAALDPAERTDTRTGDGPSFRIGAGAGPGVRSTSTSTNQTSSVSGAEAGAKTEAEARAMPETKPETQAGATPEPPPGTSSGAGSPPESATATTASRSGTGPGTGPATGSATERDARADTAAGAGTDTNAGGKAAPAPEDASRAAPKTDPGHRPAPPQHPPKSAAPAASAARTATGTASPAPPVPDHPPLTPEEAFDALYTFAAPPLVRQAYLLTGRRRLAHESVERAFHHAWQHWPDVAQDRDPVGWVRAAAYEYAMSPWQRLRPVHRHRDRPPLDQARLDLLDVLLELPPPYRRTVLLYDGLGLDLPETAAETEASTPAAANRVLHAREAIADRLPQLNSPEALHDQLVALTAAVPLPQPAAAPAVRRSSERRGWFWTRFALGAGVLIIGATGFTLATAPTRYVPEVAPGQQVGGVPGHAGPERLSPQDEELRRSLLSEPASGPGRLVPDPR
ncbi:sigma factor-like helix-turn-helix DNA-binding protein [Streptomyces sp. NPDC051018]|uniref:sigma factor-like helix-turn-helix DNA-binding protein n=1 Tax=Streptomyces sp. NPDC051018 TaxID=3365639 RepID=UPI00378E8563